MTAVPVAALVDAAQWADLMAHLRANWMAFLPELLLVVFATLLLAAEVVVSRERSRLLTLAALWLLAPVAWAIFAAMQGTVSPQFLFPSAEHIPSGSLVGGMLMGTNVRSMAVIDPLATVAKFAILVATALCLFLFGMARYLGKYRYGDFLALVFVNVLGLFVLVSATHWLMIWLAVEITTVASGFLIGYRRENASIAAAQFRLHSGFIGSGCMIFGISILYGATGTLYLTDFGQMMPLHANLGTDARTVAVLLIFGGIAAKFLVVPEHHWAATAAETAPVPVSAFVIVTSIVAGCALMIRVLLAMTGDPMSGLGLGIFANVRWVYIVGLAAMATMTFANWAALRERRVSRILAWLAVVQVGYLLVGMTGALQAHGTDRIDAFAAVGFHLWVVLFSVLAAFAGLAIHLAHDGRDTVHGLTGMGFRMPTVGVAMAIALFSLIGLPPLGGFVGKFWMFGSCMDAWAQIAGTRRGLFLAGVAWVGIVNSVVSVVYCYRILRVMYWRKAATETVERVPLSMPEGLVLAFTVLPIIALGLSWSGLVRELAQSLQHIAQIVIAHA